MVNAAKRIVRREDVRNSLEIAKAPMPATFCTLVYAVFLSVPCSCYALLQHNQSLGLAKPAGLIFFC